MIESKSVVLRGPSSLLQSIIICLNQLLVESAGAEEAGSVFNLRAAPTIPVADYLAGTLTATRGCSII